MPMPEQRLARLLEGRDGLRVIGDVHGDDRQLAAALADADAANHAVILLGDLVNRGPDSIACAVAMTRMIEDGRAIALPGNHEVRARMLRDGSPMTPKDRDRSKTLIAELAAGARPRAELARYLAHVDATPIWLHVGCLVLVHAAFPPALLRRTAPDFRTFRRGADPDVEIALDGARDPDDASRCTYDWLDALPGDLTVFIGHDPQPVGAPGLHYGAGGACLHMMDFGCGRTDGPLRTHTLDRASVDALIDPTGGRTARANAIAGA